MAPRVRSSLTARPRPAAVGALGRDTGENVPPNAFAIHRLLVKYRSEAADLVEQRERVESDPLSEMCARAVQRQRRRDGRRSEERRVGKESRSRWSPYH